MEKRLASETRLSHQVLRPPKVHKSLIFSKKSRSGDGDVIALAARDGGPTFEVRQCKVKKGEDQMKPEDKEEKQDKQDGTQGVLPNSQEEGEDLQIFVDCFKVAW